ncbi:MAG: PAS domain S-box protein [Lutibacter sp.]|uniref:PAS domain S-box protein n=1 Tax=Lutibacter sp. TaxID=1925666 RepID=UPI0017C11F35|nr:PAS domain S-box protein [Lutibacter sp.]MBT8317703.1 PAS domain S-box protein [Lutibacter sp.]NNJ58561.1 PAS domain S-box protein [Lutibacter sp.]
MKNTELLIKETLAFIEKNSKKDNSGKFLKKTASYIAELFDISHVLINKYSQKKPTIIESVVFHGKDGFLPNISYKIKNTPCEHVVNNKIAVFPNNLQIVFPKDKSLKKMNAQSYIGVPLWSSSGTPIGLISIIDDKPIINTTPIEIILQIIAIKIAQELEKEISKNKIERKSKELKRIEALNKVNEEKFSKAFYNHTVAMEIADVETGKRIDANESYLQLFEVSKEEFLKGTIYNNAQILNKENIEPNNIKLIKEGYFKNALFNILSKNGTIKNLLVSGTKLNIKPHNLAILSFLDITQQKKSEENLENLANLTFEGILIYKKGIVIETNHSFLKMFGYKKEELLEKNILELIFDKKYHEIIRKKIIDKHVQPYELEGIKKDGTVFPIEIEARNIESENNKVRVVAFRDLTERNKYIEDAKKLTTAIEQSSNTIVITDIHGTIEYVNPKFTDLTGYSYEEAIGKNPSVLKSDYHTKEFYSEIWETISSGESWSGEFQNKTKNGTIFWEQSTITPIKNNAGKITNYLAVKEDITAKKNSQQNLDVAFNFLKENEDYLSTILKSMNEGFWAVDENNITTEVNPEMCKILGCKEDDIVGVSVYNFLDVENTKILKEQDAKKDKNLTSQYEIAFKNSEGINIPCLLNTTPIFNSKGEIKGSFAMISDISSLKHAYEVTENQNQELLKLSKELADNNNLLLHSNKRFKNLFEHSPASIWEQDYSEVIKLLNQKKTQVADIELYINKNPSFLKECISKINILSVNQVTKELFGVKSVQELKKHLLNNNSKIALKGLEYEIVSIAKGEKEFEYITELNKKNGEVINAIVNSAIIDEEGKAIASVVDISALKKAEIELKASEQKFRELFEKSGDAILIINNDIFVDCNSAAVSLLDYQSKEDFLHQHPATLSPKLQPDGEESFQKAEKMISLALKNGTHRFEWVHLKNNGDEIPVEVLLTAVSNTNNNKVIHSVWRDITKRKKVLKDLTVAKEQAEESDRLKTEFLNNMSHEIRTPMNGILGFSQMLDNPELDTQKRSNFVNIIQNSGKQLLHVIDDILEISSLGTNQVKVIEEEVCLNDLLLDLFSIFDIKAKENKTPLYLKKELSDDDSIILTDNTKLNKIISNLLENALKFTNNGYIEFGYSILNTTKTPQLELYVKDTGIGIKPEKQQLIFERFQQAEKDLIHNVGGLGLGLSIAKENTELLGGKISVQSDIMKGATFFITIPFKPLHKISNTQTKSYKYTILIAEDEEINYMFIETILRDTMKLNCDIIHAKNGQEAIDICKNNTAIDMVLMDLKMPKLNGFIATKQIRKFNTNVPIIAQTAYSSESDREEALEMGCNDFISKPIKKDEFVSMIDDFLK